MKKVIIIEPQTVLRDFICRLISADAELEVVATGRDGTSGYELCLEHRPEIVIMEPAVPGLSSAELITAVRSQVSGCKFLIFAEEASKLMVSRLIKIGVDGYIQKNINLDELEKAIQLVSEGRTYFSSEIVDCMRAVVGGDDSEDSIDRLTPREREVVQLISESNNNRKIAEKLGLSGRTVDTHRANIMRKLGLHDIASLTRWAVANRLIDPFKEFQV